MVGWSEEPASADTTSPAVDANAGDHVAGWRLAGLILSPPGAFRPWMAALLTFGGGMLGLFYANVILGILEHDLWRRRLQGLAAVGRLALTNDLLQTVLITRATGRRDMAD